MIQKVNKLFICSVLMLLSCNNNEKKFDAAGTFETDEVIVSSQLAGQIIQLNVEEGMILQKDSVVGKIDAENLQLQKEQMEASIKALGEKTNDPEPNIRLIEEQLKVQQSQLDNLLYEKKRIENLIKKDAAVPKQLDDILLQIDVAKKQIDVSRQQINVLRSSASTQNRGILSETAPLQKRTAQIEEQLRHANIVNPSPGTVIAKYAETGEITSVGKPLYKVADLSTLSLRAYVTAIQLSTFRLGQPVKVYIDSSKSGYHELDGIISWISDKAEFTPKTIQTKEERANLVYAIKVRVKNDGYLKIGMYGEVLFNNK